jgi:uncharacterized protein (DUF433 family)
METALDRHVEMTQGVRGGKPRIAGTRITVSDLAIMHVHLGQSAEDIARKYDLPLAAIYAGMAYYYDHRAAIDQSIADDEAFAEEFRRNNPHLVRDVSKDSEP